MFLRIFGVGLILLSAAVYPLIGAIAISPSFGVTEKAIYSSFAYALSWIVLIIGAYFAGPELVGKLKTIYANLKNKDICKNDKEKLMRMNWIIFISIFILIILAIIFGPNAWRLYKVANLFDKNTISYNFY